MRFENLCLLFYTKYFYEQKQKLNKKNAQLFFLQVLRTIMGGTASTLNKNSMSTIIFVMNMKENSGMGNHPTWKHVSLSTRISFLLTEKQNFCLQIINIQ